MIQDPAQRFEIARARPTDAERIADEDRAVAPRPVELVHRAGGERDPQAALACESFRLGQHVARCVDPVDVEAGLDEREEQPPGTACEVERRFAEPLDRLAVIR